MAVHHLAGNNAIDNHALHRYLPARGRDAEESTLMSAMLRKGAKYLFLFSHHLLNHPADVRKHGTERDNHLLKALAPLLLTGMKIEFNRIKGREIVDPIELT